MASVKIIGLKSSKHLIEGQEYNVTPEMAELLIGKGDAVKEGEQPKKATKKKTVKKEAK